MDLNFSLHEKLGDVPIINILDVGAMSTGGDSPYGNLIEQDLARVIGFEPCEEECEKLNHQFGAPHKFYPFFIGDGEAATYYETNNAMTGSLYKPNSVLLEKFQNLSELVVLQQSHKIVTKRLDDIDEIASVDFIKIDVQGSELNVFKGASRILETALVIQVEVEFVELYENQPMFSDVDSYLRSKGFQFHTFLGFGKRCFKPLILNNNINAGLNQNLWSDAVYVKDWMRLNNLTTERLAKYALLVHNIFKSVDLCHLILSEIDLRERKNLAPEYLQRICQ